MLSIDLSGKRALVAGVADDGGFGFAIAKALAEAGATVCVGTWPPALGIFQTLLRRGKLDTSLTLADGRKIEFERIVPLDAEYDLLDDAPPEVRENKRYRERRRLQHPGLRRAAARRLRRVVRRRRRPLARQRPRGDERFPGHEPSRLPGRVERERLLDGLARAALRPADAAPRRVSQPLVHGERARHPWLRRRHVERQGGARERHARARLGGGPQVGPPRQLRSAAGPSRRGRRAPSARHGGRRAKARQARAVHRADGRVHARQLAARRSRSTAPRGGCDGPRSSAARSRPGSPAASCTSTRATMRWARRWSDMHAAVSREESRGRAGAGRRRGGLRRRGRGPAGSSAACGRPRSPRLASGRSGSKILRSPRVTPASGRKAIR